MSRLVYVLVAFLSLAAVTLVVAAVAPENHRLDADVVSVIGAALTAFVALFAALLGFAATREATKIAQSIAVRDNDLVVRDAADGALQTYMALLMSLSRCYASTVVTEGRLTAPLDAAASELDASMESLATAVDSMATAYAAIRGNRLAWSCMEKKYSSRRQDLPPIKSDLVDGLLMIAADKLRKGTTMHRELREKHRWATKQATDSSKHVNASHVSLLFLGALLYSPKRDNWPGVAMIVDLVKGIPSPEGFKTGLRERVAPTDGLREAAERFEVTFRSEDISPTLTQLLKEIEKRYNLAPEAETHAR